MAGYRDFKGGARERPILDISREDLASPSPPPAYPAPASTQPGVLPQGSPGQQGWYLSANGQVFGPYHTTTIRQWLSDGQVSWDSLVSRGQAEPWRPARHVLEFLDPKQPYGGVPTAAPGVSPYPVPYGAVLPRKDKVTAGLLALFLGGLGAHHWYLGNIGLAVAYLLVALSGVLFSIILVGLLWAWIPATLALIEGIIYLTATDDRFQRNYHNWFLSGP